MTGGRSTGVIQGYSETEGTLVIEATAIDSTFQLGQIYLFLRFNQIPQSLQHDSVSISNWKSLVLFE